MLADGRQWVAVAPPEQLPDLATWLPYVSGETASGSVLAEVRELQRRAEQARASGELQRAAELRRLAVETAVHSLARLPEPRVFEAGLVAVDQWVVRARTTVVADASALAAAVIEVEQERTRTAEALAAGDSAAAVVHLAAASERIRDWSPAEVALRVLERAEAAMVSSARGAASRERVRHLAQSARRELVEGDPVRALRRALYALQLAAGSGLPEPAPSTPSH